MYLVVGNITVIGELEKYSAGVVIYLSVAVDVTVCNSDVMHNMLADSIRYGSGLLWIGRHPVPFFQIFALDVYGVSSNVRKLAGIDGTSLGSKRN